MRNVVITAVALCLLAGCSSPKLVELPPQPESPVTNIPRPLRQTNWLRYMEGSCAHASCVSGFNWFNEYEIAQYWRKKYGGGEWDSSLIAKFKAERIPFVVETNGDPWILEYATESRRGATIWFFSAHAIWFCGFEDDPRFGQVAVVLDNNRVGNFIRIPKAQFIQRWKGYGGFALCPLLDPSPPVPTPQYLPLEHFQNETTHIHLDSWNGDVRQRLCIGDRQRSVPATVRAHVHQRRTRGAGFVSNRAELSPTQLPPTELPAASADGVSVAVCGPAKLRPAVGLSELSPVPGLCSQPSDQRKEDRHAAMSALRKRDRRVWPTHNLDRRWRPLVVCVRSMLAKHERSPARRGTVQIPGSPTASRATIA